MIISRTPYRVSFFGGGTDYPAWYRAHGGTVLATTIDKYCYLTCRYLPPFFKHRFRIVYSTAEECLTREEVQHPAVREILQYMDIDRGVEIHHDGDLPARSGMGSSSSFTVGLLHALYALKGQMPTKLQLAKEGIHIERDCLRETVGSQDQVLTAYGGFNQVTFSKDGEMSVQPMTLSQERVHELTDHLMLFYTGISRTASDIAQSYVESLNDNEERMRSIMRMVGDAISILCSSQEIAGFGELLHEAWMAKRTVGPAVSNKEVDDIYAEARAVGAIGGKLLGAGGGGFMLLFAPPAKRPDIQDRLRNLTHVPFRFESSGSQIIFFDQEQDYLAEHRFRAGRLPATLEESSDVESPGVGARNVP